MSAESTEQSVRPWSARRPQNLLLSGLMIAMALALIWQGFTYIGQGRGGLIPFLIVIGGPALAIYYIWYFNFYRFGEAKEAGRAGL